MTDGEVTVCFLAEKFQVRPSEISRWGLSDIMLLKKFYAFQKMKSDEARATDNPALMENQFGR